MTNGEASSSMEDLVKKAQNGCRESFDLLLEGHRAGLMSRLRQRTGPRLLALVELDDLYQDTCLKAFEAFRDFEFRGSNSLFQWLAGIAEHVIKNAARHHFQTRKRDHKEVPLDLPFAGAGSSAQVRHPPAPGRSPSHGPVAEERLERLKKALQGLSKDHREAIVLALLRGLPIKEIALRMGRSPDAVSMLLLRALRQLKRRFGNTDSLSLPARGLDGSTTSLVHLGLPGTRSLGAPGVNTGKRSRIAGFIGTLLRTPVSSTGLRAP